MAFRPALLSDAGAIRDLLVRSELQAEGLESLPARFFLAENEDGIAGVAGLEICGTDGLLRSVAVLREGRGRGLGRQLVDQVIDEARRVGVDSLFLLTFDAAGYFERFGFRTLDRSEVPPSILSTAELACLCPETAVCMSLNLATPTM